MSELKLRPPVPSTFAQVLPFAAYAQGENSCITVLTKILLMRIANFLQGLKPTCLVILRRG
jgi:hypothetical protein